MDYRRFTSASLGKLQKRKTYEFQKLTEFALLNFEKSWIAPSKSSEGTSSKPSGGTPTHTRQGLAKNLPRTCPSTNAYSITPDTKGGAAVLPPKGLSIKSTALPPGVAGCLNNPEDPSGNGVRRTPYPLPAPRSPPAQPRLRPTDAQRTPKLRQLFDLFSVLFLVPFRGAFFYHFGTQKSLKNQ